MRSRLAANAVLNVLAGASGALFAFAMPALLASRVDSVDLSIWSIIFQTAAYATPFALGIQGVLARHVALHAERADGSGAHATMAAAFRVLGLAALLYLVLGLAVAVALGHFYPAIPADRLRLAQWAFGSFVLGQASLIPAAAMAGYFFGQQRNGVVTLYVLGSKVLVSIALFGMSGWLGLAELAALATAITLAAYAWLWIRYRAAIQRDFGPPPADQVARGPRSLLMLRECAPISLWTFATFVIYGGTSTVASATDFAHFPAYSMASAGTMVLMGFHGAAMNPLIPHVTVVQERGGAGAIGATLARASLVSASISTTMMLAYAWAGPAVIAAVIPAGVAGMALALLPILLAGNAVRLLGLPYANTLIGLGLQGRILWTPVLEAGSALGAALWLGQRYGLAGVACGISVGGMVSILVHLLINMPLTQAWVPVRRWRLCWQSLLILAPGAIVLYLSQARGLA